MEKRQHSRFPESNGNPRRLNHSRAGSEEFLDEAGNQEGDRARYQEKTGLDVWFLVSWFPA
jgi:hypothetical protein